MIALVIFFSIIIALLLLRKKLKGVDCIVDRDMTGEVVIITGANTGIGLETARELAKRNATIIIGCRDMIKGQQAVDMIVQETNNKVRVELIKLDLSDLASVKQFAQEVKAKFSFITILINNAGVFGIMQKRQTKQNFEMILGTNYVGHYYLNEELLPLFKKEKQNRILNVVSFIYPFKSIDKSVFESENKYDFNIQYLSSKYFLTLNSFYLNKTYEDKLNLKVVAIHPGIIDTEISKNLKEGSKIISFLMGIGVKAIYSFVSKTPLQGAQCTLHACLEDFQNLKGGKYYQECKVKDLSPQSINLKHSEEIYNYTKEYIQKLSF